MEVGLSGSGRSCRVRLGNAMVPGAEIQKYPAEGLVQLLCLSLERELH